MSLSEAELECLRYLLHQYEDEHEQTSQRILTSCPTGTISRPPPEFAVDALTRDGARCFSSVPPRDPKCIRSDQVQLTRFAATAARLVGCSPGLAQHAS